MENKLDLILKKLENLDKKIIKFEADNNEEHNKFTKFEINNNEEHNKFLDSLERLEKKFIKFEANNNEEHNKILELLSSLNSAFIRYETQELDKIRILFDSDKDRKDHQKIYSHEFTRLNDLVAKNSFRISNLEKHIQTAN